MFASELGIVARLAEREPLAALELLNYRADAVMADAPWQARIRLVVHDPYHESLMLLCESALGDAVEEVTLATTARWLPIADYLPRCRHLSLAGMRLEDDVQHGRMVYSPLRTLANWHHLERLEVLDLALPPA